VRERIRINGRPLSCDAFSNYFWHCYQLLHDSKASYGDSMPAYFRFLTIMAFHVFLQEKVDVAIIEVGIGGQYDCTNILRNPIVCGVTNLGIDHTSILGDTVDKIAWHKAGIFKPNVPAITVMQPKPALDVLRDRAKEIGCPLYLAPSLSSYDWNHKKVLLGIPGAQQLLNSSLAVQLCHFWIKDHKLDRKERHGLYEDEVKRSEDDDVPVASIFPVTAEMAAGINGLETCVWPARNQKISGPGVTYYLDGAHTAESIQLCVEWFNAESAKEAETLSGQSVSRVLLFNMTGDRNTESLLSCLLPCDFDCAVFCPNILSMTRDRSDLVNLTVSIESQLRRCEQNCITWHDLLSRFHATDEEHLRDGDVRQDPADEKLRKSCDVDEDNNSCDHVEEVSNGLGFQTHTMTFRTIQEGLAWVSRGRDTRLTPPTGQDGAKIVGLPRSIEFANHVQVLCVGSLHLAGGILSLLNPTACDEQN
jgi:folylpolyglutamate synthase